MEIDEIVGTALDDVTRSEKEAVAVNSPSVTAITMLAWPNWPGAGVNFTVRFEPVPDKSMLADGSKVGLEEVAETVRLGESTS